jgi:SAM-dependent methyltransferase
VKPPADAALSVAGHNLGVYEQSVVADFYDTGELQAPERAILERFSDRIRQGTVLDIGVGAGRTTGHLSALAGRYIGVDYSDTMIERARAGYPGVDLRQGDARDLSAFADGSIDVVLFSFNGIDSVSHEDRLIILGEIKRVLAPGGLFVFSAHNRAFWPSKRDEWLDGLHKGGSAVENIRNVVMFVPTGVRRLKNHLANRSRTVNTPEYAIVCDGGHDHTLLHYYIDQGRQREQLRTCGFEPVLTLDLTGSEASPQSRDAWFYYVAESR